MQTFHNWQTGRVGKEDIVIGIFKRNAFAAHISGGGEIHAFIEDYSLLVLCRNDVLGYCGLEVFSFSSLFRGDTEPEKDFFSQSPDEQISPHWAEWTPLYLAKVLLDAITE